MAATLAPTLILGATTIVLWGFPPLPGPANPAIRSLFPWPLLAGIPCLVWALRKEDKRIACFVGPFASPYVTFHGYLPALLALRGKWMLLGLVISFIPVLLNIVA